MSSSRDADAPRVLQIFEPVDGGLPQHVRAISVGIADLGFVVTVAGPPDGSIRQDIEAAGIEYVPLPIVGDMMRARKDIPTGLQLLNLLRKGRFDVLHSHGLKASLFARVLGPLVRAPAVYTPNSLIYRQRSPDEEPGARSSHRKILLMERVLGPVTAMVIAVSEEERRAVVEDRLVPAQRARTIFNGAAVDMSVAVDRELSTFRGDGPLLGMVAGLREQKGLPTLLAALELLARRGEAVRFAIVGNGPLAEEVSARVASGPLSETTLVLPFRGRVESYLRALDAFVLPSYWEGLPIAVVEAMGAGLPVVASAVGGTPEAVRDGETGFLVPANDAHALADRLVQIAQDAGLRERMGAAGLKRAHDLFSVEEMVEKTAAVLREVSSARRLRRAQAG
jgi:glycosyltransferase involved in cell wall biosynthesis